MKTPHGNHSDDPLFFSDIDQEGYHIFNINNRLFPNYYPGGMPEYPGVPFEELEEGDRITIRVFFGITDGEMMHVEGGHVDLQVELIEKDSIYGVIITELPSEFPLATGESIELFEGEILYKPEIKEG